MIKKLLFCVLAIVALNATAQKTYVNRDWQTSYGNPVFNPILNPFGVEWTNSITDASGIVTVGHTNVSGQGENIFLTSRDGDGNLVFQVDFNSASSNNDYGIALTRDGSGNIYVCGATDNGGTTNSEIIILKYNSSGTLTGSITAGGAFNDVGTAILLDGMGNLYVAGSSESATTSFDFFILKCNASSFAMAWSNTYDYASLVEVPLGLALGTNNDVLVYGASASSIVNWDYTQASFDKSTGAYNSDVRESIPGVGYDQPLAYKKDASNNTYLTGKSWNGTDYDIRTIKITSNYTIAWSVALDGYGLDDIGYAIDIDQNGDVIIGGFLTKTNTKKDLICAKYSASTGTQIWQHTQPAFDQTGDAFLKSLTVNSTNGNIYFVGGAKGKSGFQEVVVGKIKSNGRKSWERIIKNSTYDMLPSDIKLESGSVYVISVKDSAINSYQATKYSEFEMDTALVYPGGGKSDCKKHELIVRFQQSALNTAAIDNEVGTKLSEYGNLSDFLTSSAYLQLLIAFEEICIDCDIKAVKLFDQPTTHTSTTTRLGDIVPVPDFWTTLLLEFPPTVTINQAHDALKTLPNLVAYSEPNYMINLYTPPNDLLYGSLQFALHSSTLFPNSDINVEEAWTIVPDGGRAFVKCGVFDTGIDYNHWDFRIGSSFGKIMGWDIVNDQDIHSNPTGDYMGHGTGVGGIIGAQRNNNLGVAGVAGGNDIAPYGDGIQLYSINVKDSTFSTMAHAAEVIITSAQFGSFSDYAYGLNLSNISWGFQANPTITGDSIPRLTMEAVHFASRLQVTTVAAKGNSGNNNLDYPSCSDDDWILSVGASGNNGLFCSTFFGNCEFTSNWGNDIDLLAPGTYSLAATTYKNNQYQLLSGTSGSAPYVAGVVGLLMSYMNNPNSQSDYKNLAPEDCEYIIEKSATPLSGSLPHPQSGWGRLNAGKALRMVERPLKALYHFGTNNSSHTISKSVYSNSDTITIDEPYQDPLNNWFQKGRYVLKTYQINATVNHVLPFASDSIEHFWPRPSSSAVFELFNNNKLRPRERVVINSLSNTSASLTGYIYQVRDTLGNPLGWWPCDTSFTGVSRIFEYSILVKNKAVGIDENKLQSDINVKLFPNPANHIQTIIIETEPGSEIIIELYDLMGKHVKTVYKGKATTRETTLSNDVNNLPNSMYIYSIKAGDKLTHKRFIKQ